MSTAETTTSRRNARPSSNPILPFTRSTGTMMTRTYLTAQPQPRLYLAAFHANIAGFLVGVHLALFSGITEMKSFAYVLHPEQISTSEKSLITSAYIFGVIVGAIPAGPLCDRMGRRPALIVTPALFAAASAGMLVTPTLGRLLAARFVAGCAYAIANIVCPMYSAELSTPAVRGIFVNMYQLAITAGIFVIQLVNSYYSQGSLWIRPIQASLLPALYMLSTGLLFIPESPTWLHAKGRTADALSISHRLGMSVEDGDAKAVSRKTGSLMDMLRDGSARKRLLIGAGLQMSQQLTGINAVIFFGPALVADVLNVSGSRGPFVAATVVGFANFVAGSLSMGLIERAGRKALLVTGGSVMMVSLVVLGLMREQVIGRNSGVGLGMLLIYICGFALTWGPLPFLISSEIFPVTYKGIGMSTCSLLMGIVSLGVGLSFLPLLERLGGWTFALYGGCIAGANIFIMIVVPETRNLSLAQIDRLLEE